MALSTTSWGLCTALPLVPQLSATEKTVFKKERCLATKDWVTTKPMKKEQLPFFQDFREFSPQPLALPLKLWWSSTAWWKCVVEPHCSVHSSKDEKGKGLKRERERALL